VNRDKEVRDVAARLEDLLDELRGNVEALSAILTPPDPPRTASEETGHEPA
jgi:hypothetical protein